MTAADNSRDEARPNEYPCRVMDTRLMHVEQAVRDLWDKHDEHQEDVSRLRVVEDQVKTLGDEVRGLKHAAWAFVAAFLISAISVLLAVLQLTT